jgi:transcriptional regulator with XRE-family HTH domain
MIVTREARILLCCRREAFITMTPQDTFTNRLRRYRERSHISLEQIAAATRLQRDALEAFERNDLSHWPRGVYARAWMRTYAVAIGLDPSDTVDEFCRLFPQGDRRTARTIQDMAAIVAQPSGYRDDFSHGADRRLATVDITAAPAWHAALTRVAGSIAARLIALRPALVPRLKRSPGMTS